MPAKPDRYRRAAEYPDVMLRARAGAEPFDFAGEFYTVRGARTDILPLQDPHPPLYFGGSSEGALVMGAQHCDIFAMFAEPLGVMADRMANFCRRAAKFNREPRFNMSVRPILAAPRIIPANALWPWRRRLIFMTRAFGCPWRRPMARRAIPPVWWARRNRRPMPA
ncbi:MAG: LLM class flavin-dependent oxidoreductase [Proteobacteria bacterium]|nr:LLM class flavin-dependent oxidoreductase [Pseudomonadota bacterium]MDA1100187.1 LLM class flavin-dependent oxidoreductase [Pseudomonadota bacterium]